jgi:hypothetical protein
MPTLRNAQRLILGLGMFLFLLSCAYVPWEHRYYQMVANKTAMDSYIEYHLGVPSETRYGWVFWRPVAPKSVFGGGISLSTEVNIQFLLVEWLGICLFTGGLMLLLKPPERN